MLESSRQYSVYLWRYGFYALLMLAAALTLVSRPYLIQAVRNQYLSPTWVLVGPVCLALLFAIHIIHEFWHLKNARRPFAIISLFFGLALFSMLIPSSIMEYQTRSQTSLWDSTFLKSMLSSKDARVRALAIMASAEQKPRDMEWTALILNGLADKDPLVQEAAKLVLEKHIGIVLEQGSGGVLQAQKIVQNLDNTDFLNGKGLP